MSYARRTICCLVLGGLGLGSRLGLAYEQDALALEEHRSALVSEIRTFLEPSVGKELVARGRTNHYILAPANYGVARKSNGRTEKIRRSVEYSVRIGSSRLGWERCKMQLNGKLWTEERGVDGTRSIALTWHGKDQVASINCAPKNRSIHVMTTGFVAGLKLLYSTESRDFPGDGETPLLVFLIQNSDEILDGETVEGLGEVTVVRSGTTKCYLRRSPVTHCVGVDKDNSDARVKLRIQYRSKGSSVVPVSCSRTVLLQKSDGSGRSVAGHTEAKFEDLKFTDLQSPASFLPKIPPTMRVRDNCSSRKDEASRSETTRVELRWLWILPLAALAFFGRKVFKKKFA